VPTLILHGLNDTVVPLPVAGYMASRIPRATLVEVADAGHLHFARDTSRIHAEAQRFLTEAWQAGAWDEVEADRQLATVLFTDIVRSSETAAQLGDRAWRELLRRHHALVRRELARFRGREVDTAGDGFFAAFDGPARAIRCASAIARSMRDIGIEVRAGLHTGECELVDGKVAGIAVHTGARVAAEAGPGEVLVSSTVKDLVTGSGIRFADRGARDLRAVGEWHLYAVVED
jgi:class 3 adenylate cyclase